MAENPPYRSFDNPVNWDSNPANGEIQVAGSIYQRIQDAVNAKSWRKKRLDQNDLQVNGENLIEAPIVSMKKEWTHNSSTRNVLIIANGIVAIVFAALLFSGISFWATNLDLRKYVSGALGAYFAANIVVTFKVWLWAAVNRALTTAGNGITICGLTTAMSVITESDWATYFGENGSVGIASLLIVLAQLILPSLLAVIFSTGFSTESISTGAIERTIELTEIGGCYLGRCIATSATLLGLLNWQISNGLHLDGASVVGNGEVNLFYPTLPTESVDAYWNLPVDNTTVFQIDGLPGLLVEATTTELREYTALTNTIKTTISSSSLNLSYAASFDSDQAFTMNLTGQVIGSGGTSTFFFQSRISCATADTTIMAKAGTLEIEAEVVKPITDCYWDNSSLEMWRSFESSIGIAIRYDYNIWFDSLRNDSTPSRQISELIASVVSHRLSTGEAAIKRYHGMYEGTIRYMQDRERVAPWTGYVAMACTIFILIRILFLFLPYHLLRGELMSFTRFVSSYHGGVGPNRQIVPTDRVKAEYKNVLVHVNPGYRLVGQVNGIIREYDHATAAEFDQKEVGYAFSQAPRE